MSGSRDIAAAITLIEPYLNLPRAMEDATNKGTRNTLGPAGDVVNTLRVLQAKVATDSETYGFFNEIIYAAVVRGLGAGGQTFQELEAKVWGRLKDLKDNEVKRNDGWLWPLLKKFWNGLKELVEMIGYGSVAGLVGAGAGVAAGVVVGVPAASAATVGAVAAVSGLAAVRGVHSFFYPSKNKVVQFIYEDGKNSLEAIVNFQDAIAEDKKLGKSV